MRFSNRAPYYHRYRPRYPPAVIPLLQKEISLPSTSLYRIADLGSGTGILSELFLRNGNTVFGVEPNKEMREEAERQLESYPHFISVNGQAESTTLEDSDINLITAAQSFHWFDIDKTRKECQRILKPEGYMVLIWNQRKESGSSFAKDIEQILVKYSKNYHKSQRDLDEKDFSQFYGHSNFKTKIIQNFHTRTFEELRGMLLSISYTPTEEDSVYPQMIEHLKRLFSRNQINGQIKVEYDTEIIYGQIY